MDHDYYFYADLSPAYTIIYLPKSPVQHPHAQNTVKFTFGSAQLGLRARGIPRDGWSM